jgi:hypothetical protein
MYLLSHNNNKYKLKYLLLEQTFFYVSTCIHHPAAKLLSLFILSGFPARRSELLLFILFDVITIMVCRRLLSTRRSFNFLYDVSDNQIKNTKNIIIITIAIIIRRLDDFSCFSNPLVFLA